MSGGHYFGKYCSVSTFASSITDPRQQVGGRHDHYSVGIRRRTRTKHAIHSAIVTAANVANITESPNLLREDDRVVFADAGYTRDRYKLVRPSIGTGHWARH